MSRQSEAILLQMPHVRHKKNDGTLYLMAERLGWMGGSRDNFGINLKYADIKTQKISPEGKAKIQLQIVLHDGNSTTFHFANPAGQEQQIKDRDAVKEKLLQILPKFKKKVNKELEERHRMLSTNPQLLQLYKDLVITEIQTAEEFWAQHAAELAAKSQRLSTKQNVGVSGSFLADIKPQADGANGLRYNLTADIRESIFKTYPAVRKKHHENVPGKMTEQEFWTKFFQSHYFHRDRIHAHGVKDVFTECAKDDDKAIKEQIKAGVSDKIADISSFSDKTLDENYGISENNTTTSSSSKVTPANIVHQSIIKRFNQHSIMVMKTCEDPSTNESSSNAKPEKKETPSEASGGSKRLREKVSYEDLEAPSSKKTASLNLEKTERYLNGPTAIAWKEFPSPEEVAKSRVSLKKELDSWHHLTISGMAASDAVTALVDLSPGGSLMQSGGRDALADQCPEAVQRDLEKLYSSLSELTRHFWSCFPPTNAQLQKKVHKTYETLRKFQQIKLIPFENELKRNYTSVSGQLTIHIGQMLEAVFRKYASWSQKKIR